MKAHKTLATVVMALMALSVAAFGSGVGGPYWSLAFENDTPKQLVLEGTDGKLNFFWYVVFRVSNPGDKPLPPRLGLSMKLDIGKQATVYDDSYDTVAELHLEKKVLERPLCDWVELRETPLKPGEKREGVAIFRLGRQAPDFDTMVVSVRGLAEPRPIGREGNVRKCRERVLLLKYQYVPSRWRTAKELKYQPEEWTLQDFTIADRTATEAEEAGNLSKKLQESIKKAEEARKKAEEERKRLPTPEEKKPPPKASAAPAPPPPRPAPGSPVAGEPAPELLKTLRLRADKQPYIRATFRETIGQGGRAGQASGTITLSKDSVFAAERIRDLGNAQALKELRVFDGKSLWIQTTAKGVGDSIRRWAVEATRKEWRSVDGRPEVDFGTLANPVRAWRLFGDGLVYLGIEQLGGESAYVFETRPGARFEAVLDGPIAGELLGRAAGKRVRFWVGSDSAFQRRMQISDDDGTVLGLLECSDVATDVVVDRQQFVFKAPAGVEVINMNASMADNGVKPTPPLP